MDPVRRSYSDAHLTEIGNNLEIQHKTVAASYVSNLALPVVKQVDKQVGKDTMLMIEAAMKDCGHVLDGESIERLGVNDLNDIVLIKVNHSQMPLINLKICD